MRAAKAAERKILKQSTLRGFVTPAYGGLSLANVPHTVQKVFGLPAAAPVEGAFFDYGAAQGVKNVVLLCIDGLGWEQAKRSKLLNSLDGIPITTVAPSTTATALSTLATGLTPQEHGIVGFRLFLRELGHLTNMLRFGPAMGIGSFADEGIDPELFLPFPTVYQRLRRRGVKPFVVNKLEYADSPLSRMINRDAETVPYIDLPDLFLRTERLLQLPGKKYVYAYWDMVDMAAHLYGARSEEARREVMMLDEQLAPFLASLPKGTLFLLTADHGLVTAGKGTDADVSRHRRLVECLAVPPAGEGRLRYLHCRKGKQHEVRRYCESRFSRKALVMEAGELLQRGVFGTGKPHPETVHRLGDVILIPRRNYTFSFPLLDKREHKGRHGGLSKEEMLVPLLWKLA